MIIMKSMSVFAETGDWEVSGELVWSDQLEILKGSCIRYSGASWGRVWVAWR